MVHVRGARVPAQGRRGGAALLRGLSPARHDPGEEPARQRAVGEEPLPQGREPLHRQDLRDDHARGDRREDAGSSRRRKQLPVLDKRFKQDPATRPSPSRRRSAGRRRCSASRCPELYVRNDVPGALVAVPVTRRRRASPVRRVLTGFTPQELTFIVGKHLQLLPRRALHQEPLPDAQRAEGRPVLRASRSSQPDFDGPGGDGAGREHRPPAELVKYMQPVAARRPAPRRPEVHRGRRQGGPEALDADGRRHGGRAGLLLCADLEIAKKIIAAEPQLPGRSAARRRS